jgi:hypothetical protein
MLRPPTEAAKEKEKEKEKEREKALSSEEEEESEPLSQAPPQVLDEAQARHKADLLRATEDLDKKLQVIEYRLVSPALLNSDDKYFVEPYQAYLNLVWLNAEVGTGGGDVAGGADFAPTDTQMELLKSFETEIAAVDIDYQKIMKEDLPAFNRSLTDTSVAPLVAPPSSAQAK